MKFFLDTEFRERPNTIDLISIGLVAENGEEFYAVSKDFNLHETWEDEWLRKNVLKNIHAELSEKTGPGVAGPENNMLKSFTEENLGRLIEIQGKHNREIAREVKEFVYRTNKKFNEAGTKRNNPGQIEFYGYYADFDWVVFCWLFGKMIELPKGFPRYCKDLKQMADDLGLTGRWMKEKCPPPPDDHNALSDARWNLCLYRHLLLAENTG